MSGTAGSSDRTPDTAAPPRALVAVAAALGLVLVVGAAIIGLTAGSGEDDAAGGDERLAVPEVPAPEAGAEACDRLLRALPEELPAGDEDLTRRELADPAPPATVGWGLANPVILRCGLEQPAELEPDSPLRAVDGVEWLPVEGEGSHTWYAVDRAAYIALTVPDAAGTGPLQLISEIIDETLEPVAVEVD
ncbi:DUF3515 domain-containing protein [Haloechinothrix sp. LS1_15]|uniref:DUF3515 domain-containing protein n=1 Tax=Haloechinothrix sp. LS1_15 TaxID=2652248 RepID=UPI002947EC5F|nr:DUF3515 domain-containing protein [Haloechinothrix sp. LS1_15]MDV6013482.1 DUF3515 domain-containing protein [Haloechinothrix sp. LS1_15]